MDPKNSLELLSNVAVELTNKATQPSNQENRQALSSLQVGYSCIDLSVSCSGEIVPGCSTWTAASPSNAGLSSSKEQEEVRKIEEDALNTLQVNNNCLAHHTTETQSSSSTLSHNHPGAQSTAASEQLLPTTRLTQSPKNAQERKSVLFDTVTVYHFTRSQGFISIPSQGGSTLGMKRKHFLRRKLSVDLYEEVRRRSRREILLKIKLDKHKLAPPRIHSYSSSSSASNSSTSITTTSSSSDSGEESFSEYSDISDSELDSDSFVFCQPIGVKLRRSLLRASGVGRIDPKEKRECRVIRESRDRTGCNCVNQCIPGLCECSLLGVNCHVDRISFPCGCVSEGCRNPMGRTEFDIKGVKLHHFQTLFKNDQPSSRRHQQTLSNNELVATNALENAHG